MGKIKKIYKIPFLILFVILVLATAGFFALRSPAVQTWLFDKLSASISKNNEIEISAGDMKFTFFNRIEVHDLLINDNTADTMLYAKMVKAGIRKIKRKDRFLSLGRIDIESPVIKIHPDTSGILNFEHLARMLVQEDTAKRNKDLLIRQINIYNGVLAYNSGKSPDTSQYFDLNNILLSDLNLTLDNFNKYTSDIGLRISRLSFKSGTAFELENFFTELRIEEGKYYLIDPTIKTPGSFINSELIGLEIMKNGDDFEFFRDANLDISLQSSLISLSDLGYFIEPLRGLEQEILFSGSIHGTVEEMNGRDIMISYSDSTMLVCDFDLSGMPDIDNTFMFIRIGSLTSTTHEIAEIEIPGRGRLDPGDEFRKLGAISFSGNFTGFTSDFVTYGILNTGLGSLSTDILFRPDTSNTFFYKGTLQANSVGLGKVLDREDILGSLTARMDVEGTSTSFKNFRADIEATIESLEFMDYTYRDIEINGLVTEKIWDGAISSATEDLKMDLLGRFDLTGDSPQVDFSLNLLEADLHKLNIDPTDSLSTLSMLLTASFTGNSINNITGDIRILNSRLSRNGDYFDLYDCSISAYNIDSSNLGLKLRTDYLEADIKGKYDLSSIVPDIKLAGASVFPSLISKQADTYSGKNDFSYEIRFKNTDRVNEFLETGFLLAPGFKLTGQVKPGKNISVTAAGDYAVYKQNSLEKPSINCIIADTSMVLDIYSGKLNLLNRLNLEELNINSESNIDDFNININWDNSGKIRNQGAFTAEGKFSIPDSIHTRLDMEVIPAVITINDKNWQVDRSKLTIDSNSVNIDRFMISRGDVFFLVDGKLSENPLDSINIRFNDLNLAGMNKLERTQNAEDSKETEFLLEGMLKGIILLTDVYRNPLFETDILIENFKLNDHEHGDIKILSVWDNTEKEAEISLSNNKDGKNTFSVDGAYDPQRKYLSLMALVDEMPLDILNLFLKSFASDVNGLGSGKVELISDQGKMSLQGSVMAEQASMTIDYLQSTFSFSDSISFHDNKLVFNKIQLSDNKNNKAVINGYVSNSNFKDWFVDLRIDADNILVMDTRQKDNSLFYGTAYASGVITIGGPASNLAFNISAQTQRNTRMFIPLRSGEEISDYTFIRFREDGAEKDKDSPLSLPALNNVSTKTIALNFELVVTPDAEIQLVFDSKLGDVMRARGAGTLNMSLNEDGDFTIFGDYVIDEGEYQLTLGNIFNKRFIVEDGGTISWNGDIMNANVDARAIYKLKASLEDLFQDEAYAARIPVELHLNMSGQLINPVISFDIYLPTADESMRTDLRAAIDSEEEMSRQFLYLLVMNNFYPDPAIAGASLNTTSAGASAMGVTTTEMLSNQLSNWLSQISNDFDIGFNYRPGNEISTQELEVALSTQLLNDRVIINGNFDVGGEAGGQQTGSSTNDIIGDFDVEVKITEKIRFRVFNRSNDNLVYETAPYTQGFGLFFRHSFDSFGNLFRNTKSDPKREEDAETIDE